MFYLVFLFLLIMTKDAFCKQYNDVFSGKFTLDGQVNFATLYQTDDQIDQNTEETMEIEDVIFSPSNIFSRSQAVVITQLNNDEFDDILVLHKNLGPTFYPSDAPVKDYAYGSSSYVSGVSNILTDSGTVRRVKYYRAQGVHVTLPDSFDITNYSQLFVKDLDNNGLKDAIMFASRRVQGGTQVYWLRAEKDFVNWNHSGRDQFYGTLTVNGYLHDIVFFKEYESPYHLILHTDTILYIYSFDKSAGHFIQVRTIPTDELISKILPLEVKTHPFLSSYNLIFQVGEHLSLKYFSLREEHEEILLIEDLEEKDDAGFVLDELYYSEKSEDGRFAIWWSHPSLDGQLCFYYIDRIGEQLTLRSDSDESFQSIEYAQKPFKVVYRDSFSENDEPSYGTWKVIRSSRDSYDLYDYKSYPQT